MSKIDIISKVKNPFLYKIDYLNIQSLITDFQKIEKKSKKINYKKNIKLSISSDYTSDYLTEFLPIFFANKGIKAEIYQKEYGSLNFISKDPKNSFWKKNNDFFILIPSSKNLNLPLVTDKIKDIKKKAQKDSKTWLRLWNSVDKKIIQTTFEPTSYPYLGEVDAIKYGGYLHYVRLVNSILSENKPQNVHLIDIENLVFRNQKANWNDVKMYNLTKQPFSMETIPFLSNYISNAVSGMLGMSKKAIVVDLDNTLWGGIVGDDGAKNIILGPETVAGEAFQNFQIYLKQLTEKGIVLCVCSKNDEKIAKKAFLENKNMILKLQDITIFKSNFLDKAANIKDISKILNIGLDSLIFVDDSKFECDQVKKTLPDVLTINLTEDPSDFIKIVDESSAFYFDNITKEDILRVSSYKKISKINNDMKESKNIDDFLKSINSKVIIEKIKKDNSERSSQLLAKTNQFKFNSKTFLPKDLISKNSFCIFYEDKYQNYGNIGVVIYKIIKNQHLILENWVLSCRVFSRRLEFLIIKHLLTKAKDSNCKYLLFKFEKTNKNIYLQEFLQTLNIKINKKKQLYKINIKDIKIVNLKNYIELKKWK